MFAGRMFASKVSLGRRMLEAALPLAIAAIDMQQLSPVGGTRQWLQRPPV